MTPIAVSHAPPEGSAVDACDPQRLRGLRQGGGGADRAVLTRTCGGVDTFFADLLEATAGAPIGPVTDAVASGRTVVVDDVAALPETLAVRGVELAHDYRSLVSLPFLVNGTDTGALTIYATTPHAFTPDEVALLEGLAADLGYGLTAIRTRQRSERYFRQVQQSLDAMVHTIATTVEYRDPYTAGHQRRVAQLTIAIARELGHDDLTVNGLAMAANIHDIGKISVPAEILSKPTALTPPEFELVKQHSRAGYDIVKDIDFPWPVANAILQHHERIDGSGYPDGLMGDAVGLGGRVLGVADIVEAMASHRPYRPALGLETALGEIERCRGTSLDAAVVDACLKLFREGGFGFATGPWTVQDQPSTSGG